MSSEKEESVKQNNRLKYIKRNQTRTGKSKEYINKISRVGCPVGKKKCRYCSRGVTEQRTRKDKEEWLCNCDKNDIKDIKEQIRKDDEYIVVEKLKR